MGKFYQLKDIYGNDISREQSNALKLYFKEVYFEDVLKKRCLIEDKKIRHVHHYLEYGEDLTSLLHEYKDCKVSFYRTSYEGSYQIQEIDLYDGGFVTEKTKTVSNGQKIICFHAIDILSGHEIHRETKKYCHMPNGSTYMFSYDDQGKCTTIDNQSCNKSQLNNSTKLPIPSLSSEEIEYYQSSKPFIPSLSMVPETYESYHD